MIIRVPAPVWFFVTASSLLGCGAQPNPNAATNSNPVVHIETNPKSAALPVASDEPSETDAPKQIPRGTGPLVGQHAPHIEAEFVSGHGPRSIEEARGKVVLIDFWATFCAPCRKSFPQYEALANQFGSELEVIAVSVDDPADTDKAAIEEFVRMTGAKFTVLWDVKQEAAGAYRVPKMPSSYILDRAGIVRYVHAGYSDGKPEEMAREFKALLAK